MQNEHKSTMPYEPIAIIGTACRFPGGMTDPDTFWSELEQMNMWISEVPEGRWPHNVQDLEFPSMRKAGFLTEDIEAFDWKLFRLTPKEAERMDPQQRLFLKVCWEALENAGFAPDKLRGSATGVYAGVTVPDYLQKLQADRQRGVKPEAIDATGSGFSFVSGRVAYFFGLHGPAITVDTACSSSLVAVDQACKGLILGDCDMALAGGVNVLYSPETSALLAKMNVLSPDGVIRSFDAEANGTVRGEGCGVVVLRRLTDAVRDGDRILAVIRASGVNQDGPSSGLTAPYGPAQEQLLRRVWEKSGIDSQDIGYVEAHGTGTALGDPIELTALGNVLKRPREKPLYVGTVKANIGHLEAAAGIAGLIKVIGAIHRGRIPGQLHFNTPSPHIDWDNLPIEIPMTTIDWNTESGKPRIGAVSSFGLSGTNAHVILEQYRSDTTRPDSCKERIQCEQGCISRPIKFSAATEKGLRRQFEVLLHDLEKRKGQLRDFATFVRHYNVTRPDLSQKAVIFASSFAQLQIRLRQALEGTHSSDIVVGQDKKKVAFLFTGQGSQYPGMFARLYNENDRFRQHLNRVNKHYKRISGNDLIDLLNSSSDLLHETRYTQPALFAVEYALAQMWMEAGIEPSVMIGHSIGEYVAACIAGVFTLEDAVKLVTARGEFMHALPERGKMAAVAASKDVVFPYVENREQVSIAASNTPRQTVISGEARTVDAICAELRNSGIHAVPLQVSHAFHSPLMRPMLASFEMIAREVEYHVPKRTVISNLTGRPAGKDIATCHYWCDHILAEVQFARSIASISQPERYVFVEIGPKPVLAGMVEDIFAGMADCVASNMPDVETVDQLERCAAHLFLRGVRLNWKMCYGKAQRQWVRVPHYAFEEMSLSNESKQIQVHSNRTVPTLLEPGGTYEADQAVSRFADLEQAIQYVRKTLERELKWKEDEWEETQNLLLVGMDSLTAGKLAALWRRERNVVVTPADLLKSCTIRDWAKLLLERAEQRTHAQSVLSCKSDQGWTAGATELRPDASSRFEPFALNEVQQAYWTGRNPETEWGGVSCYASFEMEVSELDPKRFRQALERVVDRHDMLRAVISSDGMQRIAPEIELPLKIYRTEDIRDLSAHLQGMNRQMEGRVIPLGQPMFEVRLTELKNGGWRIHFGVDFMIADAMSIYVFWNDLATFYSGGMLPQLDITYRDYCSYWQKQQDSERYEQDKAYWLNRIPDFPLPPNLPVKLAVDQTGSRRFVRRMQQLDGSTWNAFIRSAAKRGLTPSAALLALFAEVLSAWGGGSRFAIMMTVFNRDPVHPQIDQVIGDFTQLMLVEIKRRQQSVGDNASAVQSQLRADLEHRSYSAIEFVKQLNRTSEEGSRIYPVVFTSAIGTESQSEESRGKLQFLDNMVRSSSTTPQVWLDHQVFPFKDGVALSWDTLDDVFFPGVVNAMFETYVRLVRNAADDERFWDETLTDLRPAAQRRIHETVNLMFHNTEDEVKEVFLHEHFCRHAQVNGDHPAVICDGIIYSYRELFARSNQISALLRGRGVGRGDRVAVKMGKSFEQIATVLGIVKIGAVYVPLSLDQPVVRTREVLQKAACALLCIDSDPGPVEVESCVVTPDTWDRLPTENETEIVSADVEPDDPAYIIFTSGSTGKPKGVCVTHGAAMNTILDVNRRFDVKPNDRILGLSQLSFDLSVYDLFGILNAGGTLVLPTEAERMDPQCWAMLCKKHNVTLWNSVPALLELFVDVMLGASPMDRHQTIRRVILSGDWIPLDLFDKMKRAFPAANLTAMGGATEASIWSNYYNVEQIDPSWASIPYGYPLANQSYYILDEFGRPCPNWVEGRLHIGGKGLAIGYFNDEKRTSESFYVHEGLNERIYDTGDYGRYMDDGAIEFLGRKDQQLKINGHRIEAGEIQAALRACGLKGDAVVMPVGKREGNKKLVAFVSSSSGDVGEAQWKSRLRERLPEYMIPEKILTVDPFPITENGKIDRKQLLSLFEAEEQQKTMLTSDEETSVVDPVLQTVRDTLRLPQLSAEDDLADFGVSSVEMIKLANRLETVYGDRPTVGEMLRQRTVGELLHYYKQNACMTRQKLQAETAEHPVDVPFATDGQKSNSDASLDTPAALAEAERWIDLVSGAWHSFVD